MGTLREYLCTFYNNNLEILLRMNVQTKFVEKIKTHFIFNKRFPDVKLSPCSECCMLSTG
jgi:hypothetical protein